MGSTSRTTPSRSRLQAAGYRPAGRASRRSFASLDGLRRTATRSWQAADGKANKQGTPNKQGTGVYPMEDEAMTASAKARVLCAALILGPRLARPNDDSTEATTRVGANAASEPVSMAQAVSEAQADVTEAQADDSQTALPEPDASPAPPTQTPPPPPAQRPAPPIQARAPATQPVPRGSVPPGQWVDTDQYGSVWMPYADAYTYAPPDGYGEPYMYVFYPALGWTWVAAPWVWGFGPWPHFGIHGPRSFAWFGHGGWRSPGRSHFGPRPFRGGFAFHGIRNAPFRSGWVGRSGPSSGHAFAARGGGGGHVGGRGRGAGGHR
jgi:hypothetical protein